MIISNLISTTTSLGLFPTLIALYLSWLVYKFISAYKLAASINHHPGYRGLFGVRTLIGRFLPSHLPYITESINSVWHSKRLPYTRANTSILSDISLFGNHVYLNVATPGAVRVLNAERKTFRKPTEVYKLLKGFGENLVVTEGEEWRRHRKIAAPGFNEEVFDLVSRTTTEIFHLMFHSNHWQTLSPGDHAVVSDVNNMLLKMALTVLATASFGAPLTWSDSSSSLPDPSQNVNANAAGTGTAGMTEREREEKRELMGKGHELTFVQAITGVSENIFLMILLPKWLRWLPFKKVKETNLAQKELNAYMYGMIRTRKEEIKRGEKGGQGRKDLFNQLIEASLREEGGKGLTDEELVGNVFIFALAGHETSAHSLSFTFAYLATHPEIQEWLFEEVAAVFPDGHLPSYKDFPALPRTLAVLYETLRLHPSVNVIPKYATEDTVLMDDPLAWFTEEPPVGGWLGGKVDGDGVGERRKVFVPQNAQVQIDVVNLHRHPVYWPEPDTFKPERFLGEYNRDAFVPFSAGARGCIGRRFAEVEAVTFLALIVRHFQLVPNPLTVPPGETKGETMERLLSAKEGLTLTPKGIDLRFVRREGMVGREEFFV